MDEVCFDRMVPAEVVGRREACNLAYLPVGSLEWHGPHMPFGTDYMTVTHVAEECARRYGGVAFPAIYYGDVRYILQECREEWRQSYQKDMRVPEAYAEAFPLNMTKERPLFTTPTQPDDGSLAEEPLDFTRDEQEQFFSRLIARTMLAVHLYGFRHILLLPGHGPNPGYCRRAEDIYRQNVRRRTAFGEPAKTRTEFYIDYAKDAEPHLQKIWTHACKWEASITMVAEPGTVHLDQLPEDPKALVPGYLGHPFITEADGYNPDRKDLWPTLDALDPRNGASAEYGGRQLEAVLAGLGPVIAELKGGNS